MWFERFVIIPMSLHRDFLPSAWGYYTPTIWDFSTFIGSFGLFFTFLMLFIRVLPMINIYEIRLMVWKVANVRGEQVSEAPKQLPSTGD
jgi:molybdopterin-containing oxidoreductase family membrane subunit